MKNLSSKRTSPRFINQILSDSKISVKWLNINEWKKEEFQNLKQAAHHYKIRIISNNDGVIKLAVKFGNFQSTIISNLVNFEAQIIVLIKQCLTFLGDKTIICTRFSKNKINF